MNINSKLTAERMGYGPGTYSAIGMMVLRDRAEFALVKDISMPAGRQWAVIAHSGCDPEDPNAGGSSWQDYETFDLAHAGFNEAVGEVLIGERVKLIVDCGNRNIGPMPAGLTGTVTRVDGLFIHVKMDETLEALDEWDNELIFCSEGFQDETGRECLTVEDFLTSVEFLSGDIRPVE